MSVDAYAANENGSSHQISLPVTDTVNSELCEQDVGLCTRRPS